MWVFVFVLFFIFIFFNDKIADIKEEFNIFDWIMVKNY